MSILALWLALWIVSPSLSLEMPLSMQPCMGGNEDATGPWPEL